jgi:hypothetical protein
MIQKRENPIGIDREIQNIQQEIYNQVGCLWEGTLKVCGRVYRDSVDGIELPKPFWFEDGIDYREFYFDDRYSGTVFFLDDDSHNTEDGFNYTSNVKCVFMVNLNKILPKESDRADTKAQRDVVHVLRDIGPGKFEISVIEKKLENVLSGLDISSILFTDTHPKHCFSVNIDLSYYLDNDCEI